MLKATGCTVLPTTESQCRPFAKVPENTEYDSTVKHIWVSVLAQIDLGEKLTAKLVDTIANKILGIETKAPENKGQEAGTGANAGTTDGATDSASETARAEVRELKAKIAMLESALAAEKQAHKRTRSNVGGAVPKTKLAEDMLKAGFRAMAKKHHPDHGGSADTMKELNALKSQFGI